jgi:prophage regulatory protein
MQALLKRFNTVCTDLDIGREGLRSLMAKDPTFPKILKMGDSKQSPVFFDAAEIDQWIESKKAARGGAI